MEPLDPPRPGNAPEPDAAAAEASCATAAGGGPAVADASPAEGARGRVAAADEDREVERLLPWLRENFEAVVVAFIMALVIRCFCVEVFKIPTGSMQPTLMGHPENGDRIMVNKFALHFTRVKRFDVIVFKYPLDSSRNFVKRVVGLPGEYLKVKDGDIYTRRLGDVRFKIAKKPFEVQEGLWIDSYQSNMDLEHVRQNWFLTDEDHWELTGNEVRMDATATEDGKFTMTYNRDVRDFYAGNTGDRGGHNAVGDVKVTAAFTVEGGTGGITWHLYNEPYSFTVFLGVGGGSTLVYNDTGSSQEPQRVPIKDGALERGRAYVASVMVYDGTVWVMLDGRPVLRFDYLTEEDLGAGFGLVHRVVLGARDSILRLSRVTIQRDIHYTESGVLAYENPVEVPDGCYFMIGDNCPNSKDSRMWKRRWVRLTNGEKIEGDADGEADSRNFVSLADDVQRIKDLHGAVHLVPENTIVDRGEEWHKFVREDELVGKAFFVWWPLNRAKVIR